MKIKPVKGSSVEPNAQARVVAVEKWAENYYLNGKYIRELLPLVTL